MIAILTLIAVWAIVAYIKSDFKNTKLTDENQHLKSKCLRLEKDVREQANKNIILESVISQRDVK